MDFIIRLAEEFFKKHKRLARYRRIFAFLAAVVVFATTYELILPAITMDRQLAFRSPGVQVGVVNDQRKGIEFTEDDSFAADSAGEDAFEAGFPEEGDFFEDDTGVAGDGYAEDFSSDGTGSADDWMQAENPGAGDTWENADEIVPGADSAGDDYSGSDADGSLTDADGTGVNASAGDDLAGVPSDSSDPENSGADISVPENAENDNTDESTDLTDGNGTDSEEAGLEGTGSASHEDGQDLESADGEDSEDASSASSENISGDNTQDASTGASTADSKETDDTTDNNSSKGDTASGSTVAGSTTAGSGEAVIEGGTAETAVEFARDGAAAGATDLAALDATGQAAIAVTYPATITYEGKDYTITATFDEKAKLPAEVTLNAVEILPDKVYKDENGNPLYADYEEYYQKTLEALEKEKRLDNDKTVATARFFDITFLDKEGKAVEPAAPVSIAVKYKDALSAVDTADTMAVHFEDNKADNSANANKDDSEDKVEIIGDKDKGDNNENKVKAPAEITVPEILDTKTEVKKKTIQEISFEAEKFSVYGVIGTEVLTTDCLSADRKTYTVTVKCDKNAKIPANATLEVSEILNEDDLYNEYVDQAVAALSGVDNSDLYMSSARLFDIKILVDGKEFEPKAPVEVKIAYKTPEEVSNASTVNAVHFGKENTEVLDIETQGSEKQLDGISFTTDSFSIYAVVVFDTNEGTFEAEGQGYKVVISYTGAARFPEGTQMTIREIEAGSNEYLQLLGEAWSKINAEYFLNKEKIREIAENSSEADDTPLPDPVPLKNIDGVRFFDITFTHDGEEIEPCAPVQVQIDLDDGMQIYEHQGTEVVHFGGAGAEIIDGVDARLDGNDSLIGVAYSQSSFSPIGILATSAAKEETADVAAKGEKSSFFQKIIPSITKWWQSSAFSPMTVYAADSYAISEKEINGTLTFYDDAACTNEISSASSGTTVYIKVTPNPGYYFSSTTVTRVDEDPDTKVTVEKLSSPSNVYSFTMPAYPVIVTGVFQLPPQAGKELTPNGDGTHTLNLSVKGSSADLSTAASTSRKVNVIVVMDRSTSMVRSQNDTTIYKEFTGTPASGTTYYGLVGGEYVELNRNNGSWTYTAPGLVEYATDRDRYVVTEGEEGEQYGIYNSNVVRVYFHSGGHWSRRQTHYSYNDQTYTGTRYLKDNDATSNVYGVVNGNMASLTYTDGTYYYQSNTAAHPYNSTVYTRSTVSRLAAEQQALGNMVDSLLSYNNPDIEGLNDVVEIEVISFATGRGDGNRNTSGIDPDTQRATNGYSGTTETDLSTSKNTIMAAVNNNSNSSGTNWQEALEYAHDEADRIHASQPNEDVYILFLTDGDPTTRNGDYTVVGPTGYAEKLTYAFEPAKDLVNASYNYPDNYADASLAGKPTNKQNYFYGVFTYGAENGTGQTYLKQLVNYAYGYGSGTGHQYNNYTLHTDDNEGHLSKYFFDARDNTSLLSAMDSFIAAVFSSLAYGNVSITDGVTIGGGTNSVTSSTLISGTAGGFEYTVKGPNQGVLYTVTATGSSDNPTVTFHVNGNDYPGLQNQKTIHITGDNPKTTDVVETEYDQQLTYWCFDETNYPNYKMCLATVDDNGLVHWDLTGIGTLQNNWTYVASFEVWPNQEAYDYVAGLSNGISGFEWNTDNQVYDSEKGYYKNGTDYEYLVRYPRAGAADDDITGSTYRVLTNYEQSMSYNVLSEVTTNGETQYTYGETASVDMTPPDPMALAGTSLTVSKDWIDTIDPDQLKDIIKADPDYGVVLNLKREGQLYKSFSFKPQLKEGSEDEYEWPAQSMSIAPGIMVTHNPGGNYPAIEMGGKTYYILNYGHMYTIEEEEEDYHFEFSADPYHPMLVDNEMVNVKFSYDEHGEIDTSKGATILGDRPLTNFKGNNTLKGRLYVEKAAEVPDDATGVNLKDTRFTIQVTLKDKNEALLSTPKNENGEYDLEGLIYRILYGENHPETDEGWAEYNPLYGNYGRSGKKPIVNGIITESIYAGDKIYVGNIPTGSTYEVSEPDSTLPLGWRQVSIDYEDTAKKIEGDTEDVVTVKNTVPSFDVRILKTDQGTKPLPDAKFALYGKDYYDEEGKVNPNAVAIKANLTSGSDGIVELGHIGGGQYYLVETEAPAGYNRLTAPVSITVDGTSTAKKGDYPLYVTYNQTGNIASDDNSGVTISSEVNGDVVTYTYTLQVTNSTGAVLPHTGGSGKSIYTLGGIFIMMTAALMYVFRMRRRERRLR